MKNYTSIGIQVPDILLPKSGTDQTKWAVIACDQYTSQPEYWQEVEKLVGDAPSTFHLILPEVYLEKPDEEQRIHNTQAAMRRYLESSLLEKHSGMVYVERSVDGKSRRGLVLALDLEKYDFSKGSQSLIRATEGTIIERLPPRMRIREGASLELPHILVLIDDPECTVIETVAAQSNRLTPLYDFELMLGSGHVRGFLVDDPALEQRVVHALEALAEPKAFAKKYNVAGDKGVLLFAMGDGNHSLATAKAIWEKIKSQVGMDHPARYALVELENVHDAGLEFEPIHRVLFGLKTDLFEAMKTHFNGAIQFESVASMDLMVEMVDQNKCETPQPVGIATANGYFVAYMTKPSSNLPVGTLQSFLDPFIKSCGAEKIDYVHGQDVVKNLGTLPGNVGFYVPGMDKNELFKTVILDGALPRKTFSMGEAHEKRFYLECRKIV